MSVLESYIRLGIYFGFFSTFGWLVGASIVQAQLNESLADALDEFNLRLRMRPTKLGTASIVVIVWLSGGLLSVITAFAARNIHLVLQ